jgi:predicted RNA binding protein YcfA (HicA-like mRNA interferase family)
MPGEVAFRDVRRKLEEHGWTLDWISGSHHVFRKEGEQPISIPVHKGRVQPVYVGKVEKAIGNRIR